MDCKLRAKNCGGCPLLELPYADQLKQKEEGKKNLLKAKELGDPNAQTLLDKYAK